MIQFQTTRDGETASIRASGALDGDGDEFAAAWDAELESLLDEGIKTVVVDVEGVVADPRAARVLAGWFKPFAKVDGSYGITGESEALGALLATERAGYTYGPEAVWVRAIGKEQAALVAALDERAIAYRRIETLRYRNEDLAEERDLLWKLFVGRMLPLEIAVGKKVRTFTPQDEEDDNSYNYNVWDEVTPHLTARPFVVLPDRVLVGFNAAIAARLPSA